MIGFLANSLVNQVEASTSQLLVQLFGACFVGVYSVLVSYILMKIMDKSFNIRVTAAQIEEGLDKVLLKEEYSDS